MPTRTPKQTAGNNAFLAKVKRACNAKIYKMVARLVDANGGDEAEAREYLQGYFVSPLDDVLDGMIAILDARKGA